MIRITDIIDKLQENNPEADISLIERAYIFSARAHEGQVRLSGEPYLVHPLEVAYILTNMNLDTTSIAAGILHDVLEDTKKTPEEINESFGPDVLNIVTGLTKLAKISFENTQEREAENIRKMILAMANDLRVIMIKLADRLHNMRTLQYHKEKKRKKIARETLDIFAPIASRLGIYWMKRELEDTAFKYLDPDEYHRIERLVDKDKTQREGYIKKVKEIIKEEMAKVNLDCTVLGRYKHFFSIHQKMINQNLEFEDIYDIIAFRIILDSKSQCYEALGNMHALWKPIDIKFKDYIGRPKPNMYQSLHTTVIGPYGERIELQIRTKEMNRVAKSGIAAHWSYKEGKNIDQNMSKRFAWIQNLLENQENTKDPGEFLENVRIDLFPDEVYVFTPRGEIKTLPKGATPVDFAYLIHSEVGNHCVGARVNNAIVPLRHQLETGDVVEVITKKGGHPSRDWLKYVKTVKARSRIRQWINIQEKERSISLGRELCEKTFKKYRLNFNTISKSNEMNAVLEHFGFQHIDDLLAGIGYGKLTPLQVVRKILPKTEEEEDTSLEKIIVKKREKRSGGAVTVKGIDDMLVKFGKCCRPLPGDLITGYITRGFGVTIHKSNCINVLRANPERRIDVEWNLTEKEKYPVPIRVRSRDRVGLLADLAANISKGGANILSVNSKTIENRIVESYFTITVEDTEHLNSVLLSIRKVKFVQEAIRVNA